MRRYFVASLVGNAVWEVAQLPLYTLWHNGTWGTITFDVLHCTAGDVMIAAGSLLAAWLLNGAPRWPLAGTIRVGISTLLIDSGYTVYSEYVNTVVHARWAYSALMPVLPLVGTGLAPLAQWVVVPSIALLWAVRRPDGRGAEHTRRST